jgi:hypothetical protein
MDDPNTDATTAAAEIFLSHLTERGFSRTHSAFGLINAAVSALLASEGRETTRLLLLHGAELLREVDDEKLH